MEDLADWQVERISHRHLIQEAWRYQNNVSAYDAYSVAVARVYDAPLLAADGPLTRAPKLGIDIKNIQREEPKSIQLP